MMKKAPTAKYTDRAESAKWSFKKNAFCIIIPPAANDFDAKRDAVKRIAGKWWDAKMKRWYVPAESFREVLWYVRHFKVACHREAAGKIRELMEQAANEPSEGGLNF